MGVGGDGVVVVCGCGRRAQPGSDQYESLPKNANHPPTPKRHTLHPYSKPTSRSMLRRSMGAMLAPGRPVTMGLSLRTRERRGSGKPPTGWPR